MIVYTRPKVQGYQREHASWTSSGRRVNPLNSRSLTPCELGRSPAFPAFCLSSALRNGRYGKGMGSARCCCRRFRLVHGQRRFCFFIRRTHHILLSRLPHQL